MLGYTLGVWREHLGLARRADRLWQVPEHCL